MNRCEQDDYLIPLRYRELETKLASDTRLASRRPEPAFATVGGTSYPDQLFWATPARCRHFLLQPKVMATEDAEHVGGGVRPTERVVERTFATGSRLGRRSPNDCVSKCRHLNRSNQLVLGAARTFSGSPPPVQCLAAVCRATAAHACHFGGLLRSR